MTDPNLAASLRASLRLVEGEGQPPGGGTSDSPLSEATPDSVDLLLDEINNAIAEGMPERITDDKLSTLVDLYRSQAYKWSQEQETKKSRPRKTREPKGTVYTIDLNSDSNSLLDQ
jgi:hypothetical protein